MGDWFFESVRWLVHLLESVGIVVILGGFVVATIVYIAHIRCWTTHQAYQDYRRHSVRGLILVFALHLEVDGQLPWMPEPSGRGDKGQEA